MKHGTMSRQRRWPNVTISTILQPPANHLPTICQRCYLLPPAKRMVLLSVASVNLCLSVCVCVCLCLCVCPVRAQTFESLELETSFLVWRYTFRISRRSLYLKVIGSKSRSHDPKNGIYERSRVVRLRLETKLV